jgi:heme-degrading monooxygenase HmoA
VHSTRCLVDPANQQALIELLVEATEARMKHLPGFISVNIHQSQGGARVVNNAQWRSAEAFAAIFKHPEAPGHMERALALCKATNEGKLYEVVHVDRASQRADGLLPRGRVSLPAVSGRPTNVAPQILRKQGGVSL